MRDRVAFFDIGGTLGQPRFEGDPIRLVGLDIFPEAPPILRTLAQRGVRLGIISDIGDEPAARVRQLIEATPIGGLFAADLVIFGAKRSSAIFQQAAKKAGHAAEPQQCIFVGEDAHERAFALAAGLRVAATPELALVALPEQS